MVFAQQGINITGTVTDRDGTLPGVNISVKGTIAGVVSDANGKYQITVPNSDAVISYSFVGYLTQEVQVGAQRIINVEMTEDSQQMEEVVVTALGIKKERKALGYSVSEVSAAELLKNKNPNVINSLAGKVPGVNVTQFSGAAGAGASIVIRGGNSTSESRQNQPLFVVDGIIYDNSTTVVGNSGTDGMTRSNTTYSNRVMDINPEDVETMSVLKGAAASALYGSRAADGVIIITTKKGAEGVAQVDFSSKFSTSWVNKLPEVQKEFGRGVYSNNGVFSKDTYNSWGETISNGARLYDNIGDFFTSGTIFDNNLSISGGSKNNTFYVSASNYQQDGIVPMTDYEKTTFRFNGEQKFGRLTVAANVAYSIANTRKTLTSGGLYDGGGNGTMTAVYSWPIEEEMSHYLKDDGTKYRLFEGVWDLAADRENPYWIINKDKMNDRNRRFTGALNTSFKITNWWDISARLGYDTHNTEAYTYIAPGSVVRDIYQKGRLNKSNYNFTYLSTNIMTNFHQNIGDFDLGLLLGTAMESTENRNQTHWGYTFITAGTISFTNIANGNKFFSDATGQKRLVGAYGEFRASYKSMAYLTLTGRNDWSSTLPVENRSYFYPSVSGAFVFTELMPKNDVLSFGKVRASWAQVGKDANTYATMTYLWSPVTYGAFTTVGNTWSSGNPFLKPEIQTAWEVGAELKFLNGRVGLDYTYYHSQTENQIASPRLSNAGGYIFMSINSGSVINKGMEVAITAKPFVSKDFEWDLGLSVSYNRGTLGDFLPGVDIFYPTDAQFGTVRAASIPNGGYFMGLTGYRHLRETEKVVTGTNDKGEDIIEDVEIKNGRYQVDPATGLYRVSTSQNEIVGNREPNYIGGLNNTFRFKDLTFSFLLDFRKGGVVYNGTEYHMATAGLSKLTTLNDRKSVTVSGVNSVTGEAFDQTYRVGEFYTIGGVSYAGEAMIQRYWSNYASNSYNFITDVNWLKLRSVQISYNLTGLLANQSVIKRLIVTASAFNLFTWTNYKGMDPEVSTAGGTGGSGATGIDYCSVPAISSFSFGVNVTF